MSLLLMPKATAMWLVENTALTFEQIADFCGMHVLEIQAIADGEVAAGIVGLDPVATGQLTREELERCSADPNARLQMAKGSEALARPRPRGARYTPVSKRQDRPDAIAWLLRQHPELSDSQICKLVGTTKPTIKAVRERTHRNISNINPQDPIGLGLCSRQELAAAVSQARARAEKKTAAARAVPESEAGSESSGN